LKGPFVWKVSFFYFEKMLPLFAFSQFAIADGNLFWSWQKSIREDASDIQCPACLPLHQVIAL